MQRSVSELGGGIDHTFRIVILGAQGTGKSSLVNRYCTNRWASRNDPTIGIDFGNRIVFFGEKNIKLHLWDASGNARYRGVVSHYYKGAHAYVMTYAVNDPASLAAVADWIAHVRLVQVNKAPIFLVGTKSDLALVDGASPIVSSEAIDAFVKQHHRDDLPVIFFGETSAKKNTSVDELFSEVAENILQRQPNKTQSRVLLLNAEPIPTHDTPSFWHPWRHTRGKVVSAVTAGLLLAVGAVAIWFLWPVIVTAALATLIGVGIAALAGVSLTTYLSGLAAEHICGQQSPANEESAGLIESSTYASLGQSGLYDSTVGPSELPLLDDSVSHRTVVDVTSGFDDSNDRPPVTGNSPAPGR